MRSGTGEILWQQVHRLHEGHQLRGATDAELVTRFVESGDGGAFDELFRRTAPLVWGVCVRNLGSTPEAEDAFQAVFLLLVRNASKIRNRASIACWCYGTARKVVARSIRQRTRRKVTESSNQPYREPEFRDPAPRTGNPSSKPHSASSRKNTAMSCCFVSFNRKAERKLR